jgi:hypothetical protein
MPFLGHFDQNEFVEAMPIELTIFREPFAEESCPSTSVPLSEEFCERLKRLAAETEKINSVGLIPLEGTRMSYVAPLSEYRDALGLPLYFACNQDVTASSASSIA